MISHLSVFSPSFPISLIPLKTPLLHVGPIVIFRSRFYTWVKSWEIHLFRVLCTFEFMGTLEVIIIQSKWYNTCSGRLHLCWSFSRNETLSFITLYFLSFFIMINVLVTLASLLILNIWSNHLPQVIALVILPARLTSADNFVISMFSFWK